MRFGFGPWAIATFCVAIAGCGGDDPPGPAGRNGSADETFTGTPHLVEQWRFGAPADYYLRAAANAGVVVVVGAPNFPQFNLEKERFMVGLERDTGDERWRVNVECAPLYPSVDEERAYVPCTDGSVYALNLRDGSEAWHIQTDGAPVFTIPDGGLLYVADGDPDEDYDLSGLDPPESSVRRVRALESATGATIWEVETHALSAFITLADGVLFVAATQPIAEVVALHAATGDAIWRVQAGPATSRPFTSDGAVYVATSSGGLHKLRVSDGSQEWVAEVPGGGTFESPVVIDGAVVAGTNVNVTHRLDLDDGAVVLTGQYCDCGYEAVALGDKVVATGPALSLIDPADLGWEVVQGSNGGAGVPAIADGWLFAPIDDEVVGFTYR